MGYFSKQWCEIHNIQKQNVFDIEDSTKDMKNHTYRSISCEGIGFSKIYKDVYGRVWLGFKKQDDGYVWRPYQAVITLEKQKLNENSNVQRYS